MRGKNKCKILKQIRQKIADENDIPYVTQECTFQGECKGTCPKCEAELRYLEQQLEKRQRLSKSVTVAAVAASLMASLTACPETGETAAPTTVEIAQTEPQETGIPGAPEDTSEACDVVVGKVPYESTEVYPELDGDVAYIEPDETEPDNYFEVPTDDGAGYLAGMLPIEETKPDE